MDIEIAKKKTDWNAIATAANGGWFVGGAMVLVGPPNSLFLHTMTMLFCAAGFGILRASYRPVVVTVTHNREEIQPE